MTRKHNTDASAQAGDTAQQSVPADSGDAQPADQTISDTTAQALKEAQRQRDEYLDLLQRSRAEFDNYRRRNDTLRATAYDEGRQDAVRQLLGVLDNLGRAVEACGDDPVRVAQGVAMIYKQFCDALEGMGVQRVDDQGQPFDPNIHEALMQECAPEGVEPGTITAVLQYGYTMNGRMLRPGKVKVAQ